MTMIHETAIIGEGAQIAADVRIGPYCVIDAQAVIGSGTELMSHVVIAGHTTIGSGCKISPFAVLGGQTQDLKFKGGTPGVTIGNNTVIREYVTVNAATNDGEFTTVGDNCLIMAYTHIAHCCHIGNRVIMANACQIAGHVVVEDGVIIEGLVGIVQFLRVGTMAFVGAMSKITKDLPPYMIGLGDPIEVRSFNRIGMERQGVDETGRKSIKEAYRILYRQGLSAGQAFEKIETELTPTPEVQHLLTFCRASEKGIVR